MSKAYDLILLCEKIYGKLITAYHRTRREGMESIVHDGEIFAEPSPYAINTYGPGIYMTYDLDSQMLHAMKKNYGDYIIKCAVNIDKYLIFDADIARQIYGEKLVDWREQLRQIFHINVDTAVPNHHQYDFKTPDRLFSSDIAHDFVEDFGYQNIMRITRGLIFTGRKDGRVVLAYDHTSVKPLAWLDTTQVHKDYAHKDYREPWGHVTKLPFKHLRHPYKGASIAR